MSDRILTPSNTGWAPFDLEGFHESFSYIDDVPVLVLQFILDWYKKKASVASFDCEGWTVLLVSDHSSVYAIRDKSDPPVTHRFHMGPEEFMGRLLADIEEQLDGWTPFVVYYDVRGRQRRHRIEMERLIGLIKAEIAKGEPS